MGTAITTTKLTQALEWAYEKAMDGIPGTGSAKEFAEEYRRNNSTPMSAANSLIRWQIPKRELPDSSPALAVLLLYQLQFLLT
ncbi:hypothetical protein ACFQDN_14530 [Pseudomonas asuensis]